MLVLDHAGDGPERPIGNVPGDGGDGSADLETAGGRDESPVGFWPVAPVSGKVLGSGSLLRGRGSAGALLAVSVVLCLAVAGPVFGQCTNMVGDGHNDETSCRGPLECDATKPHSYSGPSQICDHYNRRADQRDTAVASDQTCDIPGKLGPDRRVQDVAGSVEQPSVAWTGSEYGVAWADHRGGAYEIYFARLDAAGVKPAADTRVTNAAVCRLDRLGVRNCLGR